MSQNRRTRNPKFRAVIRAFCPACLRFGVAEGRCELCGEPDSRSYEPQDVGCCRYPHCERPLPGRCDTLCPHGGGIRFATTQ